MGLIVTHSLRMNCHLAAAVIRSVRGLGLHLTARALTVRDCRFHYSVRTDFTILLFIAAGSEVGVNFDFRVNNHYLSNLVTSV